MQTRPKSEKQDQNLKVVKKRM